MGTSFRLLPALFLLHALLLSPAAGQIYQWTDKNGNTVFSDNPPPGKEASVAKEGTERVYHSPPRATVPPAGDSAGTAPPPSAPADEPKRKRPFSDVQVALYTTDWCGYCKKAREHLTFLGVSLTEYNIDRDRSRGEEMRTKFKTTGVPLIDVEGIIIRGYNPVMIRQAVEKRAQD